MAQKNKKSVNKKYLRISSAAVNAVFAALGLTFLLALISFFIHSGDVPAGDLYNPVISLFKAAATYASSQ